MSPKREILAELTTQELRASVDLYDLTVSDRRVKDQLVDALARSRSVKIEGVLQNLSPERLRVLAQAVAANGSGRSRGDSPAGALGGGGAETRRIC